MFVTHFPFIRRQVVWFAFGVLLGSAPVSALAQLAENNPRLAMPDSRLHRSFNAPVFITGHVGLGGGFQHQHGQLDYGASFIFRPGSSVNFLDALHKYNSGLVLRLDYQKLSPRNRIFSGDLIIRHYFGDRGGPQKEVLPFLGAGFGASDVTLLPRDGGGSSRYWSWVVGGGQEWNFRSEWVVVARVQYRHYSFGRAFITTWAATVAVGIPVPW